MAVAGSLAPSGGSSDLAIDGHPTLQPEEAWAAVMEDVDWAVSSETILGGPQQDKALQAALDRHGLDLATFHRVSRMLAAEVVMHETTVADVEDLSTALNQFDLPEGVETPEAPVATKTDAHSRKMLDLLQRNNEPADVREDD